MKQTPWLRLAVPAEPAEGWLERLLDAAVRAETVLDVSASPGLFGGGLRGRPGPRMAIGPDLSEANSPSRGEAAVQAHVIEVLSAIGRDHIDYYFVRRSEDTPGVAGGMAALLALRDQGHLGAIGLWMDSSPAKPLPEETNEFDWIALAAGQPWGGQGSVLWIGGDIAPRLVTVRSAEEIERVLA